MTQKIPWLRILAEGVIIVVSILLAFGIDAWWDGRQDRRLEAEYLAAILGEVDRNLDALPGNRSVLERSYSDLLQARTLLRSGSYMDSPGTFIVSLNRGLIYGVPSISTAVFDDLTNSGRMVLIRDLDMRRRIIGVYATIAAEVVRFARTDDAALGSLVAAHTPPGLIHQVGPEFSFDESQVAPEELLEAAQTLAAHESLPGALNAELRRREQERAFLDAHEQGLQRAREGLVRAVGEIIAAEEAE